MVSIESCLGDKNSLIFVSADNHTIKGIITKNPKVFLMAYRYYLYG